MSFSIPRNTLSIFSINQAIIFLTKQIDQKNYESEKNIFEGP